MNWTSTTVPLWQVDCENFRRLGEPFELRAVETPDHNVFVDQFTAGFLRCERIGSTIIFYPD